MIKKSHVTANGTANIFKSHHLPTSSEIKSLKYSFKNIFWNIFIPLTFKKSVSTINCHFSAEKKNKIHCFHVTTKFINWNEHFLKYISAATDFTLRFFSIIKKICTVRHQDILYTFFFIVIHTKLSKAFNIPSIFPIILN